MKKIFLCALALCGFGYGYAQTKSPLSKAEMDKLFPEAVKARYGITFPVFKAFSYTDQSGTNYVLLTEAFGSIERGKDEEPDTLHPAIKAVCLEANGTDFTKNWEVNDFIDKTADETSIWFWSKSCSFTDVDGDGLVEPFIVYSSYGVNKTDDGRMKIILFYKGQKIAIRHQNSVLDDGRVMEVDKAFYALPEKVQQRGKAILQQLMDNNETYLPGDWQKGLDQHKTKIN